MFSTAVHLKTSYKLIIFLFPRIPTLAQWVRKWSPLYNFGHKQWLWRLETIQKKERKQKIKTKRLIIINIWFRYLLSEYLWSVQMNSFCVNLSVCGFDVELVDVWQYENELSIWHICTSRSRLQLVELRYSVSQSQSYICTSEMGLKHWSKGVGWGTHCLF